MNEERVFVEETYALKDKLKNVEKQVHGNNKLVTSNTPDPLTLEEIKSTREIIRNSDSHTEEHTRAYEKLAELLLFGKAALYATEREEYDNRVIGIIRFISSRAYDDQDNPLFEKSRMIRTIKLRYLTMPERWNTIKQNLRGIVDIDSDLDSEVSHDSDSEVLHESESDSDSYSNFEFSRESRIGVNHEEDSHSSPMSLEPIEQQSLPSLPLELRGQPLPPLPLEFEEDTYKAVGYKIVVPTERQEVDYHKCQNDSHITLEKYDTNDDLLMIYRYSMENKTFNTSFCIYRLGELREYIKNTENILMCIYTNSIKTNESEKRAGYGCKPTNRVIVKLPNNDYITFSSAYNLLHNEDKSWYLTKLYDGRRKRIGNLEGSFGASRNHGQIPGSYIYTVRTLQDLQRNPVIRGETVNDYIITEEQLSFEYDLYTQPVYKEHLLDILLNG